jgi:NAD+ kinase
MKSVPPGSRAAARRVVIVAKRSAYRRFIEEENDPRARLLLKRRDPAVASWVASHRSHLRTLEEVERAVESLGARALIVQRAHAEFDASDAALVVSVGGDGTLLSASHNVSAVPILGVNSAPEHSVGFFCAARRENVRRMLARALDGRLDGVRLTRMSVLVNGRLRSRRVLNEALFTHSCPAATSRYVLKLGRVREEQRSSGFWVGPAAGSTAAQRSAGGRVLPLASRKLQLVVREPYALVSANGYRLGRVLIGDGERLLVTCKMPDACLFLDGPHRVFEVKLGDEVEFHASDEPLRVLGLSARRGASGRR